MGEVAVAFENTTAGGTEFSTETCSAGTCGPQRAIADGSCFDCDGPVQFEYDPWWSGYHEPSRKCLECGGHDDVEFMGRVAKRLWERLSRAEWSAASYEVLTEHKDLWQRLADTGFGENLHGAIKTIRSVR